MVESERMGRVMLDNNNEKKLLLLIPEKKISKPKALLQSFTSLSKEDIASVIACT